MLRLVVILCWAVWFKRRSNWWVFVAEGSVTGRVRLAEGSSPIDGRAILGCAVCSWAPGALSYCEFVFVLVAPALDLLFWWFYRASFRTCLHSPLFSSFLGGYYCVPGES